MAVWILFNDNNVLVEKNLEWSKKNFLHENGSLLDVVYDWKVSWIMVKFRLGFMLGRNSSVNYIYRKILEKVMFHGICM